jgi:putative ABC transport system permease protein
VNRRSRMMADLEQDIRDYIEIETNENIERGMSPEEARYAAQCKFGNVTRVREATHEIWSAVWLERFLQDLRFGIRTLCKRPQFTIAAILTLALGIGASTVIFSIVQGAVLAPLPYRAPEQLVMLWQSRPNLEREEVSWPDFQDWQGKTRSLKDMACVVPFEFSMTSPGTAQLVTGFAVSSGFFRTLGAPLLMGHDFSSSDDQPNGAPEAILSYRFWQERFASDRQAIGKSIALNGTDYTVIGVLPQGFRFWSDADLYTSLIETYPMVSSDRSLHALHAIGRRATGVSLAQAQEGLTSIQSEIDRSYPVDDHSLGIRIDPMKEIILGDTRGTLLLLLGAVGVVLLIACANVANLLLVRSMERAREFAVRLALGASRSRLIRQLLTESTLLALAGAVLGIGLAKLGLFLILVEFGSKLPHTASIEINLPVLLFTLAVSLTIGILFGIAPALRSSRIDVQRALKANCHGSIGTRPGAQGVLVILQIALTLVLVTGVGLLLRTVRALSQVNPGFDISHVLTFRVGLSPTLTGTTAGSQTAIRQLLTRIHHLPGVQAADVTELVPLRGGDNSGPFWIGTQTPASMQEAPHALYFWTGPDYLHTMGIPLLRGRFFTSADTVDTERVVVINNVLALKYFPDRDPLGQTITVPHFGTAKIVGVVRYVKQWGLNDSGEYNPSQIYLSVFQLYNLPNPNLASSLTFVVRTPLDAGAIVPEIKTAIYGSSADQTIHHVETMKQVAADSMSSQRFPMLLLGVFAGLALLLASVGIYSTLSYLVTQRVQEIGIRLALGASRWAVFRMILLRGIRLAIVGVSLGTAASLLLGRMLPAFSHLLYGITTNDPATLAAVSVVLLAVTTLACYIPSRRALKIDPVTALRYE